jgi:hypothetical protein
MGNHIVTLPDIWDGEGFFERLARQQVEGKPFQLSVSGTDFPWPKSPQYLLDFQ